MNNPPDDGGPAFPVPADVNPEGPQRGMSLRDYFAGQALNQFVRAHIEQTVDDLSKEDIAREAYRIADAMLKERNKTNQ